MIGTGIGGMSTFECSYDTLRERGPDGLALDYVLDGPRPLAGRANGSAVAISIYFGFGGYNAVLCLRGAP